MNVFFKSSNSVEPRIAQSVFKETTLEDLKGKSVRGGAVTVTAQGLKFALQTGSIITLARLLSHADFGIQSMVVAMTGFFGLFRDAGLSVATVQQREISHDQTSTLFWINAGVGCCLAVLLFIASPIAASFFREPRLIWAIGLSGTAFIFNGISAQHQALLVRNLRFAVASSIEVLALAFSIAVGVTLAFNGFGFWALIAMGVSGSAFSAAALWVCVPWRPGPPKRGTGVRSLLQLGGTATANMVVIYLGYNAEKFLLGRFWGAVPLGIYSRAYQLANLPFQQLSSSLFNVIFPALSRIQGDAERSRRFFLKGYSLITSICVPITLSCAIYADGIVPLVLGKNWDQSVVILKLLSPTIVGFALINPLGWFLLANGRAMRSLQISFLVTPVVIVGILAGISYGPKGVATGYSIAIWTLVVPVIAWAMKGTGMTALELWRAIRGPFLSGLFASIVAIGSSHLLERIFHGIVLLIGNLMLLNGVYILFLFFCMGQRQFYFDLLQRMFQKRGVQ